MANQAVGRPLGGIVGEMAKLGIAVIPSQSQPALGTVGFTGPTSVESGGSLDIESGGAFKIAGTTVTPSATELNHLKYADRLTKVVKVALTALDTGGGIFSWKNDEEGAAIIVTRLLLDITTKTTGACTLDAGTTAASATTVSDNLIDGLDINAATGQFDNLGNAGTNGKTRQKLADDGWVTGSMKTGAAAGLVGSVYIEYLVA